MTKAKIPFSLDSLKLEGNYFLPIYPENKHWLAAMKDSPSPHPESLTPAEKVYNQLTQQNKSWGIELPKKYCLFVAERNMIKDQASARNEALLTYVRLCQKIAQELNKPIADVETMMRDPFGNMQVLNPWMGEITSALTGLDKTDMGVATVTVLMQQRLTPAWTEYDTLAMPEAFFERILTYAENEREGWQVEEAEIIEDSPSELGSEAREVREEGEAKALPASANS